MQSKEGHDDLKMICDLQPGSYTSDSITSVLRDQFFSSQTFFAISQTILLSLNPYSPNGSWENEETLRQYTADYRQLDREKRISLPYHVFGLACNAYYYMMRTGQDQAIIHTGETSSGKSESRKKILRALLALSCAPPGKKGSKLSIQIPSAEYILESFAHCQTLDNNNASRYSKYTELQFDQAQKVIGYKTLNYYLEKERLTKCSAGERNFHVLYALLAGCSPDERQHLMLGEGANFRLLASHTRGGRESVQEDVNRFNKLKQAFKNVGMSKRQVASLCQVLSAILHLGDIEFYHDRHSTQESATVRNKDTLQTVSSFLGIPLRALEESLTFKTKMIRNEVCTILLDAEGAASNRDDLANFLYSILFTWTAEFVNEKLCKDTFSTFISVLDLPGPQDQSRQNFLDQFIVNFANESLHNFFLRNVFEHRKEEFAHEEIENVIPDVSFANNFECLRLITNQPGGLVHIMDDQARRMPKKTDQTMTEAFGKRWGNHSSFKLGPIDRSGATTFTISHFSGPVNYTSHQFLEKNSDLINPDFVSLLQGPLHASSTQLASNIFTGSENAFIRGLFSSRSLNIQAHPRNEQTLVAAQHSLKPSRTPSTKRPNRCGTLRRAGTLKRDENKSENKNDSDEDGNEGENTMDEEQGKKSKKDGIRCVAGELKSALDTLIKTLEESKAWFVICIRPNDHQLPNQFEARQVKQQIITYAVTELAAGMSNEFTVSMTHDEFCERYSDLAFLNAADMKGAYGGEARQKCNTAKEVMGWSDKQAKCGRMKIFLCHSVFRQLEDELRAADPDEIRANERRAMLDADAIARGDLDPLMPITDQAIIRSQQNVSPFADGATSPVHTQLNPFSNQLRNRSGGRPGEDEADDAKSSVTSISGLRSSRFDVTSPSISGTESYAPSRNMFAGQIDEKMAGFSGTDPRETVEVASVTTARRKWTCITWSLTFWFPSFLLSRLCGLKRPDIRMAWREKLAINMMVWLVCASAIFVITILGNLICPKQHVFSDAEFQAKASKYSMTRIRGEVFNLDNIITMHKTSIPVVQDEVIKKYAGIDATPIFPVQVNALCNGRSGAISPWVQLTNENTSDVNAKYHDFRAIHPEDTRPDWYYESMVLMRSNFRVGFMGYTPDGIKDLIGDGRSVGVYRGDVYDVTDYIRQGYRGAVQAPANMRAPGDTDAAFMTESLISLFNQNPGQDLTKKIDALPLSNEEWHRQRVCLRNLFFVGKKDNRNSPQCRFSQNVLLALSVIMVAIIGFKFLAALQFGRARVPEDHDKFVICQVPCYTEGEESMRKTINSLSALKYDDKRKLLFVICDGMIVGSGNDRPTPRIVLDILGADSRLEPEPLSFLSLGEGSKQHNMAKIYSGLYEHHGHVVPYVVVVKCGKPTERHRPGNRGKRDSQLILMRFLNKVHFGLPMNPMELEIFHQIKNVIGVNPSFYEYVLQVDADTEVDPWSLNKFVSAFTNDKKVIGLCGETSISNSKRTFITMLQVYEYFISHYLSKAFESLFGSVTCLPGCFSMFRIRTPDTHRPLFIANNVVDEYAENRVDTLHTKNLLHLGEDRYLTTLVLKHFGDFKTTFVRDAKARTAVPEDWSVLLSQRRRWINSTIHNLFELLSTPGLCGFCLFSMRFVVFIDLLSTIVAPVTLIYIVYLLILVIKDHATVPLTAILMLSAIYGLQAILFLLRRRFDMVVWMLIYIIGLPIWTFFLPLYSFWHMDDFSWGNTRVVMGEKGKKIVTHDEGTFDPSEIPQKTWQQYEEELWERGSNQSIGTILLNRQGTKDEGMHRAESHYTASVYGLPQMDNTMGVSYQAGLGSGYQSPVPSIYMGGSGNLRDRAMMGSATLGGTPFSPLNQGGRGSSYGPLAGSPVGSSPGGTHGLESPFQALPVVSSAVGNTTTTSVMHRPRFSTASSSYFGQVNNPPVYAGTPSGRSTPNATGQTTVRAVNLMELDSPLIDVGRGSLPTDEVIAKDIRSIISASDLNTITMKGIRAQLEAMYGTSIDAKKAFISDTIDAILGDI